MYCDQSVDTLKIHKAPFIFGISCVLLAIFGFSLALLESIDLVDPTEARYASIAQEMYLSGNWIVPHLQMPEGMVPYLGKPPLHFWLTAISYSVFGMEEWTSRLPSFLAFLLTSFIVFTLVRRTWGSSLALATTIVFISMPLVFFLGRASVTDFSLTAAIAISLFAGWRLVTAQGSRLSNSLVLGVSLGAGVLVKGPVACVIVAMVLCCYAYLRPEARPRLGRCIPLTLSALLLVAAPWFIMGELQNPGFIKYFIWNENIARYLFTEYGDRYGSGHTHIYGMSWVMLLVSAFPWSLTPLLFFSGTVRRKFREVLRQDDLFLFSLLWGLCPTVFFTFVRQLHPGYLLPALPGLAIVISKILADTPLLALKDACKRYSVFFFLALFASAILWRLLHPFGYLSLNEWLLLAGILCAGALSSRIQWDSLNRAGVLMLFLYLGLILAVEPSISLKKSAETALKQISKDSLDASPVVGVITENSFSHYWTAKAYGNELNKKVSVRFVDPAQVIPSDITDLLLKKGSEQSFHLDQLGNYHLVQDFGTWRWFANSAPHEASSDTKY